MRPNQFSETQRQFLRATASGLHSFVPPPLPPEIAYDQDLVFGLSKADQALSELAGAGRRMRNPHMLITPYLVQEAVQSTRIEGTRVTLEEMLIRRGIEDTEPDSDLSIDVREVVNYIRAVEFGITRLDLTPVLSLNLILSLHAILLEGVGNARGRFASPGQFRTVQNLIGSDGTSVDGAEFVPPPPEALQELLTNWEWFANAGSTPIPDLIACAVLHAQFETIHPFIDGNGRMGRLLITLFLVLRARIPSPLLYLSAYIERRRSDYYDRLQGVRTEGNWNDWIRFFLDGVASVARAAVAQIAGLDEYERVTSEQLLAENRKGLRTASDLMPYLIANPFMTIRQAQTLLDVSYPTARAAVYVLVDRNILQPLDPQRWGRRYVNRDVLDIIYAHSEQDNSN